MNKYLWEKRQISQAEEFQIIYVDILPSRRWSKTPHTLSVTAQTDFLPKVQSAAGEQKVALTGKRPDKHCEPGDQGQHQQ